MHEGVKDYTYRGLSRARVGRPVQMMHALHLTESLV